jgi:hypothetical protein
LFRGLSWTLAREVVGNASMFGTYEGTRAVTRDIDRPILSTLVAGGIGGVGFWAVRTQPVAASSAIVIGASPALNARIPIRSCRARAQRVAPTVSSVEGSMMPASVTAAPASPAAW